MYLYSYWLFQCARTDLPKEMSTCAHPIIIHKNLGVKRMDEDTTMKENKLFSVQSDVSNDSYDSECSSFSECSIGCLETVPDKNDILKIVDKNKGVKLPNPFVKVERCDHLLSVLPGCTFYGTCTISSYIPSVRSRRPANLFRSHDYAIYGRDEFFNTSTSVKVRKTQLGRHGKSKTGSIKSREPNSKLKIRDNVKGRVQTNVIRMKDSFKFKEQNKIKLKDNFVSREQNTTIRKKENVNYRKQSLTIKHNYSRQPFNPTSSMEGNSNLVAIERGNVLANSQKSEHDQNENAVPVAMMYLRNGIWNVEPVDYYNSKDQRPGVDNDLPLNIKTEKVNNDVDQQLHMNNIHLNLSSASEYSSTSSKGRSFVLYEGKHLQKETKHASDEGSDIDVENEYIVPQFISDTDIIRHDHSYAQEIGVRRISDEKQNELCCGYTLHESTTSQHSSKIVEPCLRVYPSEKECLGQKGIEVTNRSLELVQRKECFLTEREKRVNMNKDFKLLRSQFADLGRVYKVTQVQILKRAYKEILKLHIDCVDLMKQKECLKRDKKTLFARVQYLQSLEDN